MSDTIRKDPTEEKTVVVKKSDIEQQLHRADEEKTVLDTVNEGYKSIFDPELEEILPGHTVACHYAREINGL